MLVTAEGHAAPAMNFDIMQPLLRLRVETWADFGARLPSAPVRATARGGALLGWLQGRRCGAGSIAVLTTSNAALPAHILHRCPAGARRPGKRARRPLAGRGRPHRATAER